MELFKKINPKLLTKDMAMNNSCEVEVKYSKTEQPIPVINGVHLHSIYNPEREAEGFISGNQKAIENSKSFLIFGLGFGYHISKLEKLIRSQKGDNFKIYVIEPNNLLVEKWRELKETSFSDNVVLFNYQDVKDFFKDLKLIQFMSDKPAVLIHNASFQLNESFYKQFMSFHYPTGVEDSSTFIENEDLRAYLLSEGTNETTEEFFLRIKNKSFIKGNDYLALALSEMVQGR